MFLSLYIWIYKNVNKQINTSCLNNKFI